MQLSDSKILEGPQGFDKIFAAVLEAPAQLCIDPVQDIPTNNFQKLPGYEGDPLFGYGIYDGYALGVFQPVPCWAKGLVTPILDDVQEMPNEDEAIIITILKCAAQAESVEPSEQETPASMLDFSTALTMDLTRRPLL